MKVASAAFLCLVLAASGRGIDIEPDNPVPRDRLVRISYKPGAVVLVFGFRSGEVVVPDMLDCGEGLLVFVGPPGSYVVGGLEDGRRFQEVVRIGEAGPGPSPDPDDPDDPDPLPVPDGVYGLTKMAYELVAAMPREARSKARTIAENYQKCTAEIAEGHDIEKRLAALKAANVAIMTDAARPHWLAFGQKTDQKLNSLLSSGQIKTRSDLVKALNALADGIKRHG